MVFYIKRGEMPEFRHTYSEKERLLREELFGEESFEGSYSLLYHRGEPTAVESIRKEPRESISPGTDGESVHRHIKAYEIGRKGDMVSGRRYLLYNDRVRIAVIKPEEKMKRYFRHALSEQLFFVHRGKGTLFSPFGRLDFRKGDYVFVPKGTTYFVKHEEESEFFLLETLDHVSIPQRYLNAYGQLKEGTPYYSRDFRVPEFSYEGLEDLRETAVDFEDYYLVESRKGTLFDLTGYDGYLYPFAISTENFAPAVGKLHLPPPVHETFSGKSFMLGTFLPRKFDFHPKAIPISYYHSNIDVDEILFYSSGNFMSRKGISEGSVTIHVRGLIHGPQPGMVEGAIGKEETDEVAVMVETYDPMHLASDGMAVNDPDYMSSWTK
ncbi:MAG: homogentisate 1,2-dioxygenase [Candidatus Thermoplasmatota archaeon]|nr:homogentisate 1,2-dioxygenase [Candidatus Thermoplasmatota archaeon]MCL5438184.1 homogentisate 1,2-dioxygenase [Candidatus Thermoplasmatota archaeon]